MIRIYTKGVSADVFVESKNSEMFANILLVINQDKLDGFVEGIEPMMKKYYEVADLNEARRIRD